MSSDSYFEYLMREIFSKSYLDGLDLKLSKNKEYKPKGPLTKSLFDTFPEMFAVLECVGKCMWMTYLGRNQVSMEFSPTEYARHVYTMCFFMKRIMKDVYDAFCSTLSLVIWVAELIYVASGRNFYKLTPLIFTEFFESALREDFDKRGGWMPLERHIISKKYNEYYDKLAASNFCIDENVAITVEEIVMSQTTSDFSCVPGEEMEMNEQKAAELSRKVILSIGTSLLNEISSVVLEKYSISKQTKGSDSGEANGNNYELEDTNAMDYFQIDIGNLIGELEEKARQLILIFELLDAK
ncbi:uncharacterized protein NPIL_448201 [Nephila pilipes]|uniref:Uncharacterized protein n=1 Tax=Nephila pilipes TaxID=299642 RepID=A0A8X6JPS3_NEPPI|nr:uncharacterized protein NPIL_448201 [Nephila pilipes]